MRIRSAAAVPLALLVVAGVTACTTTVAGRPSATGSVVEHTDPGKPAGVDPSFVHNTDKGGMDRLAAAILTDVRSFWTETFPKTFGGNWQDLKGYYSVDTAHADSPAPPCAEKASDVEGNAFYCPTDDIMAWDRDALLPVLKERFGEAAVMVVLAHEMGHAVQRRSGLTVDKQRQHPDKYPTILIESQADCYSGSFVRWVADDNATYLHVTKDQLDNGLEALITFRDPIGTVQTDEGAHGDAFDRASAFQDGFDHGAKFCSQMSVDNRTYTQRGFIDAADAERGGNLPFNDMIKEVTKDLSTYFGGVVTDAGGKWAAPSVKNTDSDPKCDDKKQGPVAFCKDSDEIDVSTNGELPKLHEDIGDYATGTIVASRYGMAALDALGKPLDGADAQRQLLCLTGAYTGALLSRRNGFTLSPGDLDEAIEVLLQVDYPGRDDKGAAVNTGFNRVSIFRAGTLGGVKSCKLS